MDSQDNEAKPSDLEPVSHDDQPPVDVEPPSGEKVAVDEAEDKNMNCSWMWSILRSIETPQIEELFCCCRCIDEERNCARESSSSQVRGLSLCRNNGVRVGLITEGRLGMFSPGISLHLRASLIYIPAAAAAAGDWFWALFFSVPVTWTKRWCVFDILCMLVIASVQESACWRRIQKCLGRERVVACETAKDCRVTYFKGVEVVRSKFRDAIIICENYVWKSLKLDATLPPDMLLQSSCIGLQASVILPVVLSIYLMIYLYTDFSESQRSLPESFCSFSVEIWDVSNWLCKLECRVL